MAADASVLVTRPEGQSEALCAGLAEIGLRAVAQPMLELMSLGEPGPEARQQLLGLDAYSNIIFISANAVGFGLDWIDSYWPQLPVGINWYAIGDRTASKLKARGLDVLTPGAAMTSEGLLSLPALQHSQGSKVLIVRGEGGRDTLRSRLEQRGAQVDSLVCYRRRPVMLEDGHLAALLERERIRLVLLSSGEGLANFTALLPHGETTNLPVLTIAVPSLRVAEQASDLGWRHVRVADNATDEAMVEAARAWYSDEGSSE